MYGYIYKTTNLINGKIYVGQHKAEEFDTNYYGSGFILKQALEKYGKENFKCEILDWCIDKTELEVKEIYWIDKLNSCDNSIGYNVSAGGFTPRFKGKNHPMYGKHHTTEAKEKNRIAHTGIKQSKETIEKRISPLRGKHLSEEHKQKISKANKGRVFGDRLTADGRRKISEANKGKIMSAETRKKISVANTGKKASAETIRRLSESHKGQIGYWTGKCRNKRTKEKISKTLSAPRPNRKIQYEIEGRLFVGLVEGAEYYGVTKSCMSLWIKQGYTNDNKQIKIIVDNQLHKKKYKT